MIGNVVAPVNSKYDIALSDIKLADGSCDILEKLLPIMEKQFFNLSRNEESRRPHYFYQKEVMDYLAKLIDNLKKEREAQKSKR